MTISVLVEKRDARSMDDQKAEAKPGAPDILRRDYRAEALSKDVVHALKRIGQNKTTIVIPERFYEVAEHIVKGTAERLGNSYNHSELSITDVVISDLKKLTSELAACTPGLPNAQVFVTIHNGLVAISAELKEITSKSAKIKEEFVCDPKFFEIWHEILVYFVALQNDSVDIVLSDTLDNIHSIRVRKELGAAKIGIAIYKAENTQYQPKDLSKKDPSDCWDFGF